MSDDLVRNAWSLTVEVDRLNVALTEARAEIERLNAQVDEALRSCLAERQGAGKRKGRSVTRRKGTLRPCNRLCLSGIV